MIEKMQMVHIVGSATKKDEMLEALRKVGVIHLSEKKSADRAVIDRVQALSKASLTLKEYADKKTPASKEILSDEKFAEVYSEVQSAIDGKAAAIQDLGNANAEIDRISAWGEFIPSDVADLRSKGYDLHFYRLGKKELADALDDPQVQLIRLKEIDKMSTVAVLGTLPSSIPATEFSVPEKGVADLKAEIEECNRKISEADALLKKDSIYGASFTAQILKAQNAEEFSSASATAESDSDFVWISGYVPADEINVVKEAAHEAGFAYAIDDVADDDDKIPTKVRYSKVSRLIKPVFDILGILPGYREQDISLWFFLFFILFFAMIIGDAGYGCLILAGTLVFAAKFRKFNDALFLLTVLSVATIVWGAITGTWFGMESAMNVPFLRALVIPNFANYPELFGVTTTAQQNTIMKFSFTIGAIQMELGSLLAIRKKLPEKDLSWVSDLGWMITIVAMYLLSLYLVIGDSIPITPVFGAIGVGFVLVVLFSGMAPGVSFANGLKAGLGGAFTAFLNTISCFGNVMSYIRLFAVGMAGLAIAQSFNSIAAGFTSGPLIIVAIIVVLIGHTLNIVMCFLSVVVHGVRLNVLEFSGQVGLEWTGIPYEPFKVNDKVKQ